MRPEFLARQHGAEDGSDRDTWPSGAEHLYGTTSVGDTDAKLRRILRHWDFSRPDAWRDALEHARVQYPGDPGLDKALHTRLERFARSDCLRELASNAQIVRKEVEFVWRSGLEGASALAGVIDCLWCDRAGDWHVLQFDAKLEAPSASLAAACLALGKAVNKPLASATVYRLSDGKSARWTNDQLRLPVANGAGSASEL
jgi:hypothetical protein